MRKGERSFIYGWWYIAFRGAGVTLSLPLEWGYHEEWYDGPIYCFDLGFVHFSYLP